MTGVTATTFTGNLTGLASSATIAASANSVAGANVTGTVANATYATSAGTAGTVTTAAQPNITSVGNLTSLTVTGNTSTGNLNVTANGVITTPRIVINDGGVRSATGGTTQTLNFNADSVVLWYVPTGDTTVTLANYTAGSSVKLIVRMGAAGRNIAMGVADANNSTTGTTTITGHGPGALYGSNQAVILNYTCVDGTSANTYVEVNYA